VKLAGAAYLLYLSVHHFTQPGGEESRRTPPKARPMLGLSAFWSTVAKVELTDIVFAIDSILVAVAMSPKTWVILTGGILGIIAMRLVIGQFLAIIERYPALVDGAFVIIAWVGVKLVVEYLHSAGFIHFEIPKWLSLGLIVVIFALAFLYARYEERRASHPTTSEKAARHLLEQESKPPDA
jgi:YkoY family integral membrane protein